MWRLTKKGNHTMQQCKKQLLAMSQITGALQPNPANVQLMRQNKREQLHKLRKLGVCKGVSVRVQLIARWPSAMSGAAKMQVF